MDDAKKPVRPWWGVIATLLFWAILDVVGFFAGDIQTLKLKKISDFSAGALLFPGAVYQYNVVCYLGGFVLFAGALAGLWFLLLRDNYISVEENPWLCKTLREVLHIAGALGLVVACILSMMVNKSLGDSLTPGWASFITMVIWPASALALALFGGKLRR